MTYDRVRIIKVDGSIAVLDKSFSQMVELLKGLSKEDQAAFWKQTETKLPNGDSVYLVREGV